LIYPSMFYRNFRELIFYFGKPNTSPPSGWKLEKSVGIER